MPAAIPFATAARFWLVLGWINFGGPAGQIAILHRELVERRGWIDERRFTHALNYCMLLPGPEAMQLATYIGWLLHGTRGALVAGVGFILPSVAILLGLSWLYVSYGHVDAVAAVLAGFKPVVVTIVALAVLSIGWRALKRPEHVLLAVASFVAIQWLDVPFPLIVLAAITVGVVRGFATGGARNDAGTTTVLAPAVVGAHARFMRAGRLLVLWLALTLAPLLALASLRGPELLEPLYLFFTRAAFVTFGGAYAVLAYVNQAAVEQFGWLTATQAVDGFALAETTPGPLIMVLQFVGYLAGWSAPGPWSPGVAAVTAALLTTYATFLPSFFFILLGAPYIERLRGVPWLDAALTAVTAAVVGVILNLGVVFGSAVLFPRGDWNVFALIVAIVAALVLGRGINVAWIVLVGGVAGLVAHLLGWITP